jgi:hypothetical protein
MYIDHGNCDTPTHNLPTGLRREQRTGGIAYRVWENHGSRFS